MAAILLYTMDQDAFLSHLGGPDQTLENWTAQQMADAMQAALAHMTSPGARSYPAAVNSRIFWQIVIEHLA